MPKKMALYLWVWLCLACTVTHAQSLDSAAGKLLIFPSRLLGRVQAKMARLDQQLTQQTTKYLEKMQRREARLKNKLSGVDSVDAKKLFGGNDQRYAALLQKIRTDTGNKRQAISGEYQPYVDSLQGALRFLQQNPKGLNAAPNAALASQLQRSISQLQQLQAKMKDADQAKAYLLERKQQIGQYIAQHTNMQALLGSSFSGMRQDVYYYSQQVHQYRHGKLYNYRDECYKTDLRN
jgi:hypothetical protein